MPHNRIHFMTTYINNVTQGEARTYRKVNSGKKDWTGNHT